MANRYFLPQLPAPGPHELDGDLAHHLGRVLRIGPGAVLRLGDGRGGTAAATVTAVHKHTVRLEVAAAHDEPPPAPRVTLAFCVVRSPRVDWLFEHATEVGVAAFQPLWTMRTRAAVERPERWLRIVQAAAGQCDRAWLPTVHPACDLDAFLLGALPERRFVGSAVGTAITAADRAAGDSVLLVGPEGGFAADELAAVAKAGFAPRRFGPHILRTETAALVGAALLLAEAAGVAAPTDRQRAD